jgi:hypothetical protein
MRRRLGRRSRGSPLSMHSSPAITENQDPWDVVDPKRPLYLVNVSTFFLTYVRPSAALARAVVDRY